MDLEQLNIEVRPRNHFQALDLGVLMARRWYGTLLTLVAVPVLTLFCAGVLLAADYPLLVVLLIWWLKPAYERLPLKFLSTAIFGSAPSVREVARFPAASVLPGLLGALTIRRFSPRRSFDAPVWVLERLSGRAVGERRRVLGGRASSAAFWLTVIGIHVESFLQIGLITTAWLLLPDSELSELFGFIEQDELWEQWMVTLISAVCLIAIAPFYVACGFSLYLNRRAELEAWDVEVGFRRLASRIVGVAAACLVCALIVPEPAGAEESGRAAESRAVISEVLDDETFVTVETYRYPEFVVDWLDFEEEETDWDLQAIFKAVAQIGEVLLWLGLGALIVWILVRLNLLDWATPSARDEPRARVPGALFGVSIAADELPEDVLGAAAERWQAADQRGALSLLLRSALVELVDRNGCRFRAGYTEGDCVAEVSRRCAAETHAAFAALINEWRYVAYAHRVLPDEVFDRLAASWPQLSEAP